MLMNYMPLYGCFPNQSVWLTYTQEIARAVHISLVALVNIAGIVDACQQTKTYEYYYELYKLWYNNKPLQYIFVAISCIKSFVTI